MEVNRIYNMDWLEGLKTLPDKCVNTCITSPPYWNLRDYGTPGQLGLEPTPEEYVAKMVEGFREVRRVLRDDGTLWLNLGDSYTSGGRGNYDHDPRPGRATRPKGGLQGGTQTVDMATISRPGIPLGLKPKDLVGIPWRVAFALQADDWFLRSDIIWVKPNPMPESVTDRPTKAHEYIFLLSKSERYYYDAVAIKEPAGYKGQNNGVGFGHGTDKETRDRNRVVSPKWKTPDGWDTSKGNGGHGSFHRDGREDGHTGYVHKSGNKERKFGTAVNSPNEHMGRSVPWEGNTRNKRTVWTVSTKPFSEAHFATFPPDLIKPCILAGAPADGIVLDPFMGAGTTALTAWELGRNYIGFELNPEYCTIAEKRIQKAQRRKESLGVALF